MDLRQRRKRTPSVSGSSRSGSVSSVSSGVSDTSSGSGKKKGRRSANRKTRQNEDEVISIVFDQIREMAFKLHIACQKKNSEKEQLKKEGRNADPLYQATRKYAECLLAKISAPKKKEELKNAVRTQVMEKLANENEAERNKRADFLARLQINREVMEEDRDTANIHSPALEGIEQIGNDLWLNIEDHFPLLVLAYQDNSEEFVEKVNECSRNMETMGEACLCRSNDRFCKVNPLLVAASCGNIEFFKKVVKASEKENGKHLEKIIKRWCSDGAVMWAAIENELKTLVEFLANKQLLGETTKIHGEFGSRYGLTMPCMLASIKESVMLKFMIENNMVGREEYPRIMLEAVNTDDVNYVKCLLDTVRYVRGIALFDILTSTAVDGEADMRRDSPFHRAVLRGNKEMVTMLRRFSGTDRVEGIDSNGLSPMYFALATGQTEIYEFFYEKQGIAYDHAQQVFDIGMETNQERLAMQVFEHMVKYFNHSPGKLYDYLLRAICSRTYIIVEEMVKRICQNVNGDEMKNNNDYVVTVKKVLSAGLTCGLQLFTEADQQLREDLCAMLILAGARPVPLLKYSVNCSKKLQEVMVRLNQVEEVEGMSVATVFCGRKTAMAELSARLLIEDQ